VAFAALALPARSREMVLGGAAAALLLAAGAALRGEASSELVNPRSAKEPQR
jgi:hypothetical protein